MPELPEVNTFKKYFDAAVIQKRIMKVTVQDDKIMRNLSGEEFIEKLKNRTFIGSSRRGKYLFGHLDNGHHLLLHFGMTGDLQYYSDPDEKPKHERFSFQYEDGMTLGFDCPRKFARIVYITDLPSYIEKVELGMDALEITEESFVSQAKGKKVSIKGFMLNQKILAGVGNLYADEICYLTKVHPGSKSGNVPKKKMKEIYAVMQDVLHKAIERAAHYKDDADELFWQWRVKGVISEKGEVIVEQIAGRTTYYVKGWQKKY